MIYEVASIIGQVFIALWVIAFCVLATWLNWTQKVEKERRQR